MSKQRSFKELRDRVRESLDNSLENGYKNPLINPPKEVAEDLAEYDSELESVDPPTMEPIVAEWQGDHAAEAFKVRAALGLK